MHTKTRSGGATVPIAIALGAVYLFWGGTYLAMKFAIETMPPYLMAGSRFLMAGAILYIWQVARGTPKPQPIHWRNAAVVGGLLLLGGNGGVVWAEQMVPSGLAAIVIATVPLWMVLLGWLWQGGKRPNGLLLVGLALGLIGIVLLMKNDGGAATTGSSHWIGYVVLVFAALSWATGSVYSRVAKLPSAPLMGIALQMLTGGLLCLVFGLVTGETARLDFAQMSLRSVVSWGYLVFFGSIIAFSAYIWLLKTADLTMVSTYAYVNPIVALLLGWVLAGEQMTAQNAVAAAIVVVAVFIITKANSPKPAAEPLKEWVTTTMES